MKTKPPLYMVVDSDDTEYKYATYEDATEAFDLLFEIWQSSEADHYAWLHEGGLSAEVDEIGEPISSSPEPYLQKWNADQGQWEEVDYVP